MLEIIYAGGWLMAPILLCSVLSVAIIAERFWALRRSNVVPPGVGQQVEDWAARHELDRRHIDQLRSGSALGRVLAAAEWRQLDREGQTWREASVGTLDSLKKLVVIEKQALRALDRSLAELYATVMKHTPASEQGTLKAEQRGWVKGRNDCWKSDDQRGCIKAEYEV